MRTITSLGKKWEIRHSLWLLLLCVITPYGYIAFIPFFYIGIRAQKNAWIYWGVAYLCIEIVFLILAWQNKAGHMSKLILDWSVGLFLLSYFTAWVQAFWVRRTYLKIISQKEIAKNPKSKGQADEKVEIEASLSKHPKINTLEAPLDINIATRHDLALILGPENAEKIIKARKANDYFTSFTEILHEVYLKPHQLNHLKKHFVIGEKYIAHAKSKYDKSRGRKVDY